MRIITEIDQNDLLLITVPEKYKNFEIQHFGYAGAWIMETDGKGLNNWKQFIGKGWHYEILGFTKDIVIGEQMKGGNFLLKKVN